jgi:hypothetical protein
MITPGLTCEKPAPFPWEDAGFRVRSGYFTAPAVRPDWIWRWKMM